MNDFYPHASGIKYVQDDVNTCSFISPKSALFDTREYVVEQAIISGLKSSLLCEYFSYKESIRFSSNIMIDNFRNKGDQNLRYELHQ